MRVEERERTRVDTALQETQTLLDQGELVRASMLAARAKLREAFNIVVATEIDLAAMIEDKESDRRKESSGP